MAIELEVVVGEDLEYHFLKEGIKKHQIDGLLHDVYGMELRSGDFFELEPDAKLAIGTTWMIGKPKGGWGVALDRIQLTDILGNPTESVVVISVGMSRTNVEFLVAAIIATEIASANGKTIRDDARYWLIDGWISAVAMERSILKFGLKIKHMLPLS